MNLSHALMTRLSDAASRLSAGVHEAFTPQSRAEAYERMHDALIPALDQFIVALTKSGRALQTATAPYLDQIAAGARNGATALQDNTIAGAQAIGEALQKQRGVMARHPYVIAMLVVGTGYVAYRRLSQRRPAAARGARAPARKSAAASRARPNRTGTRTQRERRPRAAATTNADTKAIH